MEMEDQYGITDLRQLISRGNHPFPSPYPPQPPPDLFSHHHHRGISPPHYDMLAIGARQMTPEPPDMFSHAHPPRGGGGLAGLHHHPHQQQDHLNSDSTTTTAGGFDGGDGGSGRWPRQETLTLLEVRSRLHLKFKESNQKGPLWDEVSRILAEEHGYQRSGKKCREKFENLYKYYKKTKDGKAGRQDGKHYRFFRQLEALYGSSTSDDTHISQNAPHFPNNLISPHHHHPINPHSHSGSLSNSSDFEPSSSDEEEDVSMESNGSRERKGKRRKGRSWKGKMKEFIDAQMGKMMEKQEVWLEKMMKTLEEREDERFVREEEWRNRQEAARVERENKFWENERAWIQARDSALIKALERVTHGGGGGGGGGSAGPWGLTREEQWSESEIQRRMHN